MVRLLGFVVATYVALGQTPTVYLSNGDIFMRYGGNREVQVTHDGSNREAVVSPDGKRIAIVREAQRDVFELLLREMPLTTDKTLALVTGPVEVGPYHLDVDGHAEWSPDSTSVYFLLRFSATSAYLARLDVSSSSVKGVSDAILYAVVRSGKYKGKIIALKRKHTLVSVWNWYWLLDEDGSEIGPIGDQEDLSEFIDRFCDRQQRKP